MGLVGIGFGQPDHAVDMLRPLLNDSSPDVRGGAAVGLGLATEGARGSAGPWEMSVGVALGAASLLESGAAFPVGL